VQLINYELNQFKKITRLFLILFLTIDPKEDSFSLNFPLSQLFVNCIEPQSWRYFTAAFRCEFRGEVEAISGL